MSGSTTIIKDEKDPQTKQNMLEHKLSDIMDDSHDFGGGGGGGGVLSHSKRCLHSSALQNARRSCKLE